MGGAVVVMTGSLGRHVIEIEIEIPGRHVIGRHVIQDLHVTRAPPGPDHVIVPIVTAPAPDPPPAHDHATAVGVDR